MQNLSLFRQFQLSYLGRIYAFAYKTNMRRFLSFRYSSWIKLAVLLLFFAALLLRWPLWCILLLLLLQFGIWFLYHRAQQANYSRFVPDKTAVSLATQFPSLPPNEHVKLRATGLFALSNRESPVLLRPAEYWRAPLGDHVVMVQERPDSYLYQFFKPETVEAVHGGWLLFGRKPIRALAVTFCSEWGPGHNDPSLRYYVRGEREPRPCRQRTIYFTFASDRELAAVMQSLASDLPD